MLPDVAIDQLTPGITVWQRYDPGVKADLFSTVIHTPYGIYLVDPIGPSPVTLPIVLQGAPIAGVVVTNANHARAAADFSEKCGVPIYADPDATTHLSGQVRTLTRGGSELPGLETIPIPGGPPGEIAIFCDAEGGTLILGDALINMGAVGFSFLPVKYCTDAKLMRKSLRQLLPFSFQRILFAHGTPIVSRASARLFDLLEDRSTA